MSENTENELRRNSVSGEMLRGFVERVERVRKQKKQLGADMGREAVIERLITTIHPHPSIGKPRLWSLGAKDAAALGMAWPLRRAEDIPAAGPARAEENETVVSIADRRRAP